MTIATAAPQLQASQFVDPEHPWLGLHSFDTSVRDYFFGREAELRDLFERVQHRPLTILFGQSGLGKTSLLHAGLAPRLKETGWQPIFLRLRYEADEPHPSAQIRVALLAAARERGLAPVPEADMANLWLLLHDPALGLLDPAAPQFVLLLDQFEEIFTLGSQRPGAGDDLRLALAAIVENRPPQGLDERLVIDDDLALRLRYETAPVRVVLSLREDFLHLIERWKRELPAFMENRMELRLLTGLQALRAVVEPGKIRCCLIDTVAGEAPLPLVSEEVGAEIVRVVARAQPGMPLEEIDAVPPLLSLMCDELNRKRPEGGGIDAALVESEKGDILQNFYERSFEELPPAVRRYVEENLVTSVGGHRKPAPRVEAEAKLERAGVAEPAKVLDHLVERRLLTVEERGGIPWIEITHDVLTDLVVRSRQEWHERERVERLEREKDEAEAQRKRKLRQYQYQWASVVFLLLTVLATVSGMLAWKERAKALVSEKIATQARDRANAARTQANNARAQAEELINFMTFDMRDKLDGVGRLDLMKDLTGAMERYHSARDKAIAEGMEERSDDEQRRRSVNYDTLGDILKAQGSLAKAGESYLKALAIRNAMDIRVPNNAQSLRDLSVSYEKLGGIMEATGKLAEAEQYYCKALEIREALAARDPQNTQWQYDLSASHEKLGEIRKTTGKLAEAELHYRKALEIRDALIARDPNNVKHLGDLSVSYNKLGDGMMDSGKLAEAELYYHKALTNAKALAEREPNNALYLNNLSDSYEKLGSSMEATGKLAEAELYYRKALEIREALAARDPQNTQWQYDLSASHEKLGEIRKTTGKLAEAELHYRKALEIRDALAARDPDNLKWRLTLSVTYHKMGVLAEQREKWTEARDWFTKELPIIEDILGVSSGAEIIQYKLRVVDKLITCSLKLGNYKNAKTYYHIEEAFTQRFRKYADKKQLANALVYLGVSQTHLHFRLKAYASLQEAKDLMGTLPDVNPQEFLILNDWLSWTATLIGKFPEALKAGEAAVKLLNDDAPHQARMNLAHAYLFNDQFEKAEAIYQKYLGQAFRDGSKWNDEIGNDFKTLREAGRDHPNMKKIEALLKK